MDGLTQSLRFFDNGNAKRERENLQNYIFESIDMRNNADPVSFYRSDFRGAKFLGNFFSGNNFSNADYIDCFVSKTIYERCVFKVSEIYNSYFELSEFSDTLFSSTSFVRVAFKDSAFRRIKFTSSNIQDSSFENCEINDCSFFKTSIDEVTFSKTSFKDVDLSPMTAINLYFDDCTFENVIIDADYLGSYFFRENFLDALKLKYRRKLIKVKLDKIELLANLFKMLFEKNRFYEAINIVVQKNFITKESSTIFPMIKFCFQKLENEYNTLIRGYQIKKLFRLFEYYFNTGYIKLNDYFKTIRLIESLDISDWSISEQLDIISHNDKLKNLIFLSPIESSMIDKDDLLEKMVLTIIIEEKDEEEFEKLLECQITNLLKVEKGRDLFYFIASKRKGSLIYEIIIYSSLGLLLINTFKKYLVAGKKNNRIVGLRTELAANALTKMIDQMNQTDKTDDIRKILEVAQLASTLNQDSLQADNTTTQLLSIIKGMQGQPTALKD